MRFCSTPLLAAAFGLVLMAGTAVFGQEKAVMGRAVRVCPLVEASDPPAETVARLASEYTRWFGVYDAKSGRKLGWCCGRQELVKWEGQSVIRCENSSEFTFSNGGGVSRNFLREEYFFSRTAPYRLLQLNAVETKGGSSRITELKQLKNDDYAVEIREGKETRREQLTGLQFNALQFLSASTWAVSPRRKAGQHFVTTVFDVRDLIPYAERHEWRGPTANGNGGTVVDSLDTNGMFKTVLTYDAKGLLVEANVAGATMMRLETEARARKLGSPVDLHLQSEVPCDRILGIDLRKLKEMKIQLTGEDVRGVPDTDRQAVSLLSREDLRHCTIHLRKSIGLRRPARPDDVEANLLATAQLPLGDPRIIALAKKAVGDATAPAEKVRHLLDFVSKHITDDILAEPIGIFGLLKDRRGDCTEHALLFTALARASGIPCREATGFIYLGDSVQRFGGHAWNEVILDGHWHEVDPTWNLFHLTPGHILLSSGKATAKDLRFLSGGLEIKVAMAE